MFGTASAFLTGPAAAQDAAPVAEATERVTVTGSRIVRRDFTSTSPIATVTGEQAVQNADITLETYLNTLPQVNAGGTTSSNNPSNNGQAAIDLRGLGPNRNLVLVNGRRPMVSAQDQTVDLNTIPQALIERVEVITGGAGAAYGADAVAGVVNIILKNDFEGADFRAGYSNSTEFWDSEEYSFSGVIGGNFADDKGNAAIAIDRAVRQPLYKSQRAFSINATSTTTIFPTGRLVNATTNSVTQAAVDALFATAGYGSNPAGSAQPGLIAFNNDGTVFSRGVFNSPLNVLNFRYALDGPAGPNLPFFPDFYSYNFDAVNLLVLPYERKTFMAKADHEILDGIEVFAQANWTEYQSTTALAPTPVSPRIYAPGTSPSSGFIEDPRILPGGTNFVSGLLVPVSNPFVPADLATLLASRGGDNARIVGAGAGEAFLISWRALGAGLREQQFENTVVQYLTGVRGDLGKSWEFEVYLSEGLTEIEQSARNNIRVEETLELLADPLGGTGICAGGFNPFGVNTLSQECIDYITVDASVRRDFKQQIGQAYARGPLYELPAGDIQLVVGAEHRSWEYQLDPGSLTSPVQGFNTLDAIDGTNSFTDFFTELLVPLVADAALANRLELGLAYRYSESQFTDRLAAVKGPTNGDSSYKADLLWEANDWLLGRASYQRSVRAPNFGELFAGGSSFPQYFDPCSVGTAQRTALGAAFTALCTATGVPAITTYVASPGGQFGLNLDGNVNLEAEVGDTWTLGAAFTSNFEDPLLERLRLSVDYYNIQIDGVITAPDPNLFVANCYNYFGNNPGLVAGFFDCLGVSAGRGLGGGELVGGILNPGDPSGNFPGENLGYIKTDGVDVQLEWGFGLDALGFSPTAGAFGFSMLANWVNSYAVKERASIPELEYVGTVPFFGSGGSGYGSFGQAIPEWRLNMNFQYTVGDWGFLVRTRMIDEMRNRAEIQFPGERFTGTPTIWYVDLAAEWAVTENAEIRLGVNNVADRLAPSYSPNVQSGTDPSTFDVVGRRVFTQLNVRF